MTNNKTRVSHVHVATSALALGRRCAYISAPPPAWSTERGEKEKEKRKGKPNRRHVGHYEQNYSIYSLFCIILILKRIRNRATNKRTEEGNK